MRNIVRNNITRVMSVVVILAITITLFFDAKAKAETTELTAPNVAVYDNLLTNRMFVEDTFTGDAFPSDNPYSEWNGVSGSDYMYADILNKYETDATYRDGVNVYYRIEHLGETVSEIPSALIDLFVVEGTWDNFVAGAKKKNYNAVLSKSLSNDYQSESGQTLNNELADIQTLRSYYNTAKTIKGKYGEVNEWIGLIKDVNNIYQNEYATKVLPSYSDSIYGYLDGVDSVLNDASKLSGKTKTSFSDLYEAQYYALYGADDESFNEWRTSLEIEHFASSTKKYLSVAKSAATVSSSYLDNIVLLEQLFQQRDSLSDTLSRVKKVASSKGDKTFVNVSNDYIDMLGNDYSDDDTIVIEVVKNTLISYAASNLEKYMWSKTTDSAKKFVSGTLARNAVSKEATSLFVAQKAEKISNLLSTATFLGDSVTSFGDTCEKIYEIKYLQQIKKYAISAYYDDKNAYLSAKNSGASMAELDELAKNALDDLAFLKRLTLRANEIGYSMTKAQAGSAEGKFLDWIAGCDTVDMLNNTYTKMQNAMVDTVINPISQTAFTVEDGEKLTVLKDTDGCVGIYVDKDGNTIRLPEFQYKLLGGLELAGGDVVINNQTTEDVFAGNIAVSSSGGTLTIGGAGNLSVGEMEVNRSLSLERLGEGCIKVVGNLQVRDGKLDIGAGRVEVGGNLTVQNSGFNGYIIMDDEAGYLLVNGDMSTENSYSNRTVSQFYAGTLELKGDLTDLYTTNGGCGWNTKDTFKMIFSGDEIQNIHTPYYSGTYNGGYLGDLKVTGAGIATDTGFGVCKLESDLVITGDVPKLMIDDWNGYNVNVENNLILVDSNTIGDSTLIVGGNLRVKDTKLIIGTGRVEVGGNLTVQNNGFNGYIIMDDEAGYLLVNGDMSTENSYSNRTVSQFYAGTLELKGDLTDLYTTNGGCGWNTKDTFKMIFSGDEIQNIHTPYYSGTYNGGYLGDLKVTGAGIATDTGFGVCKLESDLVITGDVLRLKIEDWNSYTLKIKETSVFPVISIPSGYGKLISKSSSKEGTYDISYSKADMTYTVQYYVDSSLKTTQKYYRSGSLAEPYQISLNDGQEFDGWYMDSSLTDRFDIENDVITSDLKLYGRILIGVTDVTIDTDALEFDEVGERKKITASVAPSNATDKNVSWTVSDNSIAKVSDDGSVEAVSVGSTTITVHAGKKEASCVVKVHTRDIGDLSVLEIPKQTYTGKAITPVPVVKSSIRTLKVNTDYSVSYDGDNVNVGTVTVSMNGIQNYCGMKTTTFEIVQADSVVTPRVKKQVIYEGESFPEIEISEGDTPGTISFDESKPLEVGEWMYVWNFVPDDKNYKSATGTCPITVLPVEVESIYIGQQPVKLEYKVDEQFDATGLKIIARYNNGSEKEVNDYTVDLEGKKLGLEDDHVTISYIEDGKIFTSDLTIEVFEELSDNAEIKSVVVRDTYGTISDNSVEVVLPQETTMPVSKDEINITTADSHASIQDFELNDELQKWFFRVLAQDNITDKQYSLLIRIAESENDYLQSQWNMVNSTIGRLDFGKMMNSDEDNTDEDNSAEKIKELIVSTINNRPEIQATGITVSENDVDLQEYVPAKNGDADDQEGSDGTYVVRIYKTDGENEIDTGLINGSITAKPYTGTTNQEILDTSVRLIQTANLSSGVEGALSEETVLQGLVSQINCILSKQGFDVQITKEDIIVKTFVEPQDGTKNNPSGTEGLMTYVIQLKKGKTTQNSSEMQLRFSPKKYSESNSNDNETEVKNKENKNKEATDRKAAAAVIEQVKAIGTVTLNHKDAIEKARAAYNALSDDAKKFVLADDLKLLTDAEAKYVQLKADKKKTDKAAAEAAKKEEVGAENVVGGATYVVAKNQTVIYKASEKKDVSSVKIPKKIQINSKDFVVTEIAANAFKNNKKLTKVTMPKSIKVIGKNAFQNCSALKTATIGSNVTTIGNSAFEGCSKLTKVTIPARVTKIGKKAFCNCKKLKTVIIKTKSLKFVGSKAFTGCYKTLSVKVPKKKLTVYKKLLKKKVPAKAKVK